MIALKSGSVLLAVSALAVLVQSSGVPDGHPGEIVLNREGCMILFRDTLKAFPIGPVLKELLKFSRRHYGGTFVQLVMQRNARYEQAMGNKQRPVEACESLFRLGQRLYEDPNCGRYIQNETERDIFVSELVGENVSAKARVEAIYACYHAGGRPANDDRVGFII